MEDKKQLKYLRNYLKVSILTLVFFVLSFGIMFIKAHLDPNPPRTDNGLGMAYAVFTLPVSLTFLLFFTSKVLLHFSKSKPVSKTAFILASVLTIPVAFFGFLMLFATVFSLVRLLLRLIFQS